MPGTAWSAKNLIRPAPSNGALAGSRSVIEVGSEGCPVVATSLVATALAGAACVLGSFIRPDPSRRISLGVVS